jgi:hypothetical protein
MSFLMSRLPRCLSAVACLAICTFTHARQAPVESAAAPAAQPAAASDAAAAFTSEELEQLMAPLALYPDSLLSQIFMASTYPLEIVEADRWVKANPTVKDAALTTALEKQDWDPSVKSLVNFPDVLAMMSENLDTTKKIGDAFIAQQKECMAAVQRLRAKAKEQGNLESNQQQTVKVEPAAAGAQTQTIIIESSDPEVVYVPQYNPTVVYGSWPYPSYPPYPYYPPAYPWGAAAVGVGVGIAVGAAWGYAWGNCNWGGGDVDIDVNRNTNINNNIDRSKHKNQVGGGTGRSNFQHDPSHRKGVGYRDSGTASKYGGRSSQQTAQARDSYRGRADAGRQDIARGGADQFKGSGNRSGTGASAGTRDMSSRGSTSGARPSTQPSNRSSSSASNRSSSGSKGSSFSGSGSSGSSTRAASSRGSSSRSSSSGSSRSSGSRSSGGSRGGGGGGRGGGGRR